MRRVLNVEEIRQVGNNGCWMAACSMINLYYRGQRLFWESGRDIDLPGDINTVARLNGFRWINIPINFSDMKNAIDENQLLLADTTLEDGPGHAVLISGYDDTNGQEIYVLDPAIANGGIGNWLSYIGTGTYHTGASNFDIDGLYYVQYDHL